MIIYHILTLYKSFVAIPNSVLARKIIRRVIKLRVEYVSYVVLDGIVCANFQALVTSILNLESCQDANITPHTRRSER